MRVTAESTSSVADGRNPRVCILGGGFGGLYTALRLSSLPWPEGAEPQVTLVDMNENFVFKPLLYELLNGGVEPHEVAPSYQDLLASTKVSFRKARVQAIEPVSGGGGGSDPGRVTLEDGETMDYDWLVLALGAQTKVSTVPGVKEHALPFSTLADAQEVDRRLSDLEAEHQQTAAPIQVAIVGGGVSGVELAATVAERLGQKGTVQLLTSGPDIMLDNAAGQREAARKTLLAEGAEILTEIRVSEVQAREEGGAPSSTPPLTVQVQDGRSVQAHLVLWTAGQEPVVPSSSAAVGAYGLPLAAAGEAVVDPFMRVRRHRRIFALGDAAYGVDAKGNRLPATAQVAFQAADYVGWNVWASINKRPLLPFKYQHLGDMMALGASAGAVAFPIGDITLDGPAASILRKAAYVYRQPTVDQAVKVGLGFLTKPVFAVLGNLTSGKRD